MPLPAPRLPLLLLLALSLSGCLWAPRQASWRILPLQRREPHDGLAVVSQPDGFGVLIWLATDTSEKGICRPRWTPDPERLFNGDGTKPFGSGRAGRDEFFAVVARRDVRRALRREQAALCGSRAPRSRFEWQEPPLRADDYRGDEFPMLEEGDLLSDPRAVREQEELLIPPQPEN